MPKISRSARRAIPSAPGSVMVMRMCVAGVLSSVSVVTASVLSVFENTLV